MAFVISNRSSVKAGTKCNACNAAFEVGDRIAMSRNNLHSPNFIRRYWHINCQYPQDGFEGQYQRDLLAGIEAHNARIEASYWV